MTIHNTVTDAIKMYVHTLIALEYDKGRVNIYGSISLTDTPLPVGVNCAVIQYFRCHSFVPLVCMSCLHHDLETSFSDLYILRISRLRSGIRVIGSKSRL